MSKASQKASLKISQDVIETIARVAALEVDGVANTAQPQGKMFGKWNKNPIEVKINDGVAEVSMALTLHYGAKITETCCAVQRAVKDNVQTMTGIMVSKVNIAVEGITLPEMEIVLEPPVEDQEPQEIV